MIVSDILQYCLYGFYALHVLFSVVSAILNRRKINKLCDECHIPVISDEEHNCVLTDSQLKILSEFISSLKEDNKNG
ncbi:hypothetical protein [Sigmofec virus UA08Rod_5530]|uniref:Uncharacterized protein n=1 Tax=Sigmofec virus UA08Rod_5530 TaxID=2929427 RepID=A0A976N1S3_9VIRU|nr:hypothetical protein [Sigmofec virus UA08Rod_5530]